MLALEGEVRDLRRQVKELKDRLSLNSSNSSKPPSTDGLAKQAPKSLRKKTGRKPGGQPGHPGRTLELVAKRDHIIPHKLDHCTCGQCQGRSLGHEPVLDYAKRQVFELPQKPLEVTEHQAEIKRCPVSGRLVTAPFPVDVKAAAQYGPRFKAQMVEATIAAANQCTYDSLAPFELALVDLLPQAPLNHCDESGVRVAKKLYWLHVVSNANWTFYGIHPKRGVEAMDYFNILPRCKNWIIHDHFKPYFT